MKKKFLSIILAVTLLFNATAQGAAPFLLLLLAAGVAIPIIEPHSWMERFDGETPEVLDMYTEEYHRRVWSGYIYDIPKITKAREWLTVAAQTVTTICREKAPKEQTACYLDPSKVFLSYVHYSRLSFQSGKSWEGDYTYEVTADAFMEDKPFFMMAAELAKIQFLTFFGKYPAQKIAGLNSFRDVFSPAELNRYDPNKPSDLAELAGIYSRRIEQIIRARNNEPMPQAPREREWLNMAARTVTQLCLEKAPTEKNACQLDTNRIFLTRAPVSSLYFPAGRESNRQWVGVSYYEITANTLKGERPYYEMVGELARIQFLTFGGAYAYQRISNLRAFTSLFTSEELKTYNISKPADLNDLATIYGRRLKQIVRQRENPGQVIPQNEARIGAAPALGPIKIDLSAAGNLQVPQVSCDRDYLADDRFRCSYKPKLSKWLAVQTPKRKNEADIAFMSYGVRDQIVFRHSTLLEPIQVLTACEPRVFGEPILVNKKSTMEALFKDLPKCIYLPIPTLINANFSVLDEAIHDQTWYSWQRQKYIYKGIAAMVSSVVGYFAFAKLAPAVFGSGSAATMRFGSKVAQLDDAIAAGDMVAAERFAKLATQEQIASYLTANKVRDMTTQQLAGIITHEQKLAAVGYRTGLFPKTFTPFTTTGTSIINTATRLDRFRNVSQAPRIALLGGAFTGVAMATVGPTYKIYSWVEDDIRTMIQGNFEERNKEYMDLYLTLTEAYDRAKNGQLDLDHFERLVDDWARKLGPARINLLMAPPDKTFDADGRLIRKLNP
ncbi:MAG: hypothetical protein ABL958_10465 [Bdellovibrionia bacterium]